jgi:hypothetical protein
MSDLIISVDVEADGPCPGINSMLQLGAVFYAPDGTELRRLSENLELLDGATPDPATMKWWAEQYKKRPGLWASTRTHTKHPSEVMELFQDSVRTECKNHKLSPLVVTYPGGFDFIYLYYYLVRFCGQSCVGFSCFDMKSAAVPILKLPFRMCTKRNFPNEWFNPKLPHTHSAIDDALEQGYLYWQQQRAITGK